MKKLYFIIMVIAVICALAIIGISAPNYYVDTQGYIHTPGFVGPNGTLDNVSRYTSLTAAISSIGTTTTTLTIDTTTKLSSNTVVPKNITISHKSPGIISCGTYTALINGHLDALSDVMVFDSSCGIGDIQFGDGSIVTAYNEWWGAKSDGVTVNTPYYARAMASGAGIISFSTGTYVGNIVVNKTGITLQGAGSSGNPPYTHIKSASAVDPVIFVDGDSIVESMERIHISDLLINGNAQVPGLKVTATAPKVVDHSVFERLQIINTTNALHVEGLGVGSQGEVYNNTFREIRIYQPSVSGIYHTNAVYNTFQKIEIVNTLAYAITSSSVHGIYRDIQTDGVIFDGGQQDSWENITIEQIYATVPPVTDVFTMAGYKSRIRNLTFTEIDNAKCSVGLKVSNDGHVIEGVRTWGTNFPIQPISLQAGSSGTIIGISAASDTNHSVDNIHTFDVRKNWNVIGDAQGFTKPEFTRDVLVSTASITILDISSFGTPRLRSGLYLVQGTKYDPNDPTIGFTDLILVSAVSSSQTVTTVSTNNIGAAAARTYSIGGTSLLVSMATNTYMLRLSGTSMSGVNN